MPDLADGEVAHVKGSAKDPYELKNTGGVYSCSCPAWRNAGGPIDRRTCKHLKGYRGVDAEAARLGAEVSALGATTVKKAPKPKAAAADGDDDGVDEAVDGDAPPVLLAHKWEGDVDLTGWWLSEKLDGVRAYWDGTRFVSRLGNAFIAPQWFTASLPKHPLDGELWVGRKEFQKCVSIVRRQDAGDAWREVRFLVFDAPHLELPFEGRVEALNALFGGGTHPHAEAHIHVQCTGLEHLRTELARVESLGGEGLMLRQPGSLYETGRSTTLLKVKTFHDAEGRVVGHEPGKGKHKGRLGAVVVEMDNGIRFNVGTGFSDKEREDPPPIGTIITYRYQELSKDGVPRFPTWVGLAIDKASPTAASSKPLPASQPASKPAVSAPAMVTPKAPVAAPAPPAPLPAASSGTARRFVMGQDGGDKFWEIDVVGAAHTVRFGKVGSTGQERTKTFPSAAAAAADAARLVAEKTGTGYRPA